MPFIQMQRVRSLGEGWEQVVDYVDLDVHKRREYEDALAPMERACGPREFVRTVGSDSPLLVRPEAEVVLEALES